MALLNENRRRRRRWRRGAEFSAPDVTKFRKKFPRANWPLS